MEAYLLKSAAAIALFYGLFWLLFRNETYFKLNRIYLILSVVISITSPLLNLDFLESAGTSIVAVIEPIAITAKGVVVSNEKSLSILSIIYISGVVFFTLSLFSKLSRIYYLYIRFPKVQHNGFRTVLVDSKISPFTFFSILYLSRSDYENGNISEIVAHESAHKEQYHSFDVLLIEFATILQWFNPFIWLIRMAIKSEHEFLADRNVLEKGYDKLAYQTLLFEKSLGVIGLGITSNFNYSLLKTRLKMMTIQKSGSLAIAKYILSLPLVLSICFILSTNMKVFAQEKMVYDIVEKMPVYKDGEIRDFIAKNMKYPKISYENGAQGRVFVQFIITEQGKVTDVKVIKTVTSQKNKEGKVVEFEYKPSGNPKMDEAYKALEEEAARVVRSLGDFNPGEEKGEKVRVRYTMPITYLLN